MAWYLPHNPLLWFELRARLRGRSSLLLLTGYLLGLGVILVLAGLNAGSIGDLARFGRMT